ncbi:hypothetical protein [Alteromonas sp. OM2203]|uniref:hypothetical protein n=1 Tax=Alteromonas sp. OM2203 TaxID=3398817 RepID=UPI003AF3C7F7
MMSDESSKADDHEAKRIDGLDYALLNSLVEVEVDEVSEVDLLGNDNIDRWPTLQPQADLDIDNS